MGNVIHVIYGIPSEMSSNTVMWSVGGTTKTCDVILCNVFNRVLCCTCYVVTLRSHIVLYWCYLTTLKADQSYTKKILKGLVLILFDKKMILDGDIKDVMLNLILCHRHNCIP